MSRARQSIEIRPVSGALGAEIQGVDLSKEIGDSDFDLIRQAYDQYGVIFFRDQDLTPEAHIAFAERWGEININRFFQPVEAYPMIAEVRKEPRHKANIGGGWHTDHSYDEVPAMGSILYAKEVPAFGGDTLFASMVMAYEALSPAFRDNLEGLMAIHSSRHVFGQERQRDTDDFKGRLGNPDQALQDAVHPVILCHPRTSQKALYVNPTFTMQIEGWHREESDALLNYLYRHAQRPEFTCRFRWRQGSVAFWDNLSTWHNALNDYQGQRRLMHRITIEGTPLH